MSNILLANSEMNSQTSSSVSKVYHHNVGSGSTERSRTASDQASSNGANTKMSRLPNGKSQTSTLRSSTLFSIGGREVSGSSTRKHSQSMINSMPLHTSSATMHSFPLSRASVVPGHHAESTSNTQSPRFGIPGPSITRAPALWSELSIGNNSSSDPTSPTGNMQSFQLSFASQSTSGPSLPNVQSKDKESTLNAEHRDLQRYAAPPRNVLPNRTSPPFARNDNFVTGATGSNVNNRVGPLHSSRLPVRLRGLSWSQSRSEKSEEAPIAETTMTKNFSEDNLDTRLDLDDLEDITSEYRDGMSFDWHNSGVQDTRLQIRFDSDRGNLKVSILAVEIYTPNVDYLEMNEPDPNDISIGGEDVSGINFNGASTRSPYSNHLRQSRTVSSKRRNRSRTISSSCSTQAPKSLPHLAASSGLPSNNTAPLTASHSTSPSTLGFPVSHRATSTKSIPFSQFSHDGQRNSSHYHQNATASSPRGSAVQKDRESSVMTKRASLVPSSSITQPGVVSGVEKEEKFMLEVFISANNRDTDGSRTDIVEAVGKPVYRTVPAPNPNQTAHAYPTDTFAMQEKSGRHSRPQSPQTQQGINLARLKETLIPPLHFRQEKQDREKMTPIGYVFAPVFTENEFMYSLSRAHFQSLMSNGVDALGSDISIKQTNASTGSSSVSNQNAVLNCNDQQYTSPLFPESRFPSSIIEASSTNALTECIDDVHLDGYPSKYVLEDDDEGGISMDEKGTMGVSSSVNVDTLVDNATSSAIAATMPPISGVDFFYRPSCSSYISHDQFKSKRGSSTGSSESGTIAPSRRGTDTSKTKQVDMNSHLTFVLYMGTDLLGELYIPIRNIEMKQSAWYHMSPADNSFLSKMRRLERHRKYQPWHGQSHKRHHVKNFFRKSISFNNLFTVLLVGQVILCVGTTAALFTIAIREELYNATAVLALEVHEGIVSQLNRSFHAVETMAINSGAYVRGLEPTPDEYNQVLHYEQMNYQDARKETDSVVSAIYIATPENNFYGFGQFNILLPYEEQVGLVLPDDPGMVKTYATVDGCNSSNLSCEVTDFKTLLEVDADYLASERVWYQLALNHTLATWTNVYAYASSSNMGITCSYRIPSTNDTEKYIFGADVRISDIQFIMDVTRISYISVTPASFVIEVLTGRLIMSSNMDENVTMNRNWGIDETQPYSSMLYEAMDVGTLQPIAITFMKAWNEDHCNCSAHEIMNMKCSAECANGIFDVDGNIFVMSLLRLSHERPWVVVVVVPVNEYTNSYQIIYATAVTVVICATVFSVTMTVGSVSQVSSQFSEGTKTMKNIATLNLNPELGAEALKASPIKEVARMYDVMYGMQRALTSFFKYVPPDVIKLLMRAGYEAKLGGERRYLTIFFSDIVDFTRISEQLDPESLIEMLSVYLSEMSGLIQEQQGTVDKYIGDAVMAMWNAPETVLNHAYKACRCALLSQQRLLELREGWKDQHLPDIGARIGIHTGYASVGNFGSKERLTYTALGDTVNFATRLEALNKEFGTEIIISESTYAQVKDQFVCRPLDIVSVSSSGQTPVPAVVYELIGDHNTVSSDQLAGVELFRSAFAQYRQGRYSTASRMFNQYLERYSPNDIAARTHIATCRRCLISNSRRTTGR
eukprot:CFRG5342T1